MQWLIQIALENNSFLKVYTLFQFSQKEKTIISIWIDIPILVSTHMLIVVYLFEESETK